MTDDDIPATSSLSDGPKTPKKRGRPPLPGPKLPPRPTMHDKVEVYEELLHTIQLHAEVTMRPEMVRMLLQRICAWSYAHRRGNGEIDERTWQANVDGAFWKLKGE